MTLSGLAKTTATALSLLAAAPAAMAQHWGEFRDDGCVAEDLRAYSSVLWDIPWGASWETACANMPATVAGQHFSHPTICAKSSVAEPLSYVSALASIGGLAFPPAGVAGTVVGTSALALDAGDWGALNMWGVFYVQDPQRC